MIDRISFLVCVLLVVSYRVSGKPTNVLDDDTKISSIKPIESLINEDTSIDNTRQQRSPQFGFFNEYGNDYSYEDQDYEAPRNLNLGHKRKPHKLHHKPLQFQGGHGGYYNGCRGYDCGENWHQENGHYNGNHEGQQGGSFATASAGSISGGGTPHGGGGHSEASSQSASFNFGPYSATFSVAQAAASARERF